MTDFSISIDIQAHPDSVFEVMTDIERWPEWTPSVTSIKRLNPGPLVAGSRAVVRQPKLPPALWTISEFDPARHTFTWISTGPGIKVYAVHSAEPHGQGARATLSLRFTGLLGPLFGRLTANINNRYLAMEANGLKARSESAAKSSRATA